jgi:hypothetical protein
MNGNKYEPQPELHYHLVKNAIDIVLNYQDDYKQMVENCINYADENFKSLEENEDYEYCIKLRNIINQYHDIKRIS